MPAGGVSDPFEIVDVGSWEPTAPEEMGKKPKVWLVDPNGRRWLFKSVRHDAQGARAEDWAEKLAAEVALLLGIPAARVELARRAQGPGSSRGVISHSVLPDQGDGHQDHALHHGNELLRGLVPEYEADRPGPVSGYTLDAVWQALIDVGVPPGTPSWVSDARSLFAGYLLLDGLIGNTDRHHQNWAVIRPPDGGRDYLSPSFDHASCLGFQESQESKARRLAEGRVEHWTGRAKSKFEGQPSPIEVARQALARLSATESGSWRARVDALRDEDWLSRIEAIPADLMSQVDRTFAAEVMRINRKELLDVT